METEVAEFEGCDGQADDGGLVELRRDGVGEGQHLSEGVELEVFLPATRAGRIARLLLAQFQDAATENNLFKATMNAILNIPEQH